MSRTASAIISVSWSRRLASPLRSMPADAAIPFMQSHKAASRFAAADLQFRAPQMLWSSSDSSLVRGFVKSMVFIPRSP